MFGHVLSCCLCSFAGETLRNTFENYSLAPARLHAVAWGNWAKGRRALWPHCQCQRPLSSSLVPDVGIPVNSAMRQVCMRVQVRRPASGPTIPHFSGALEGKFSVKNKSSGHPHTNMAKAALNMMTHTACKDAMTSCHSHSRRFQHIRKHGSLCFVRTCSVAASWWTVLET